MHQEYVMRSDNIQLSLDNGTSVVLQGRLLYVVRSIWLLIAILSLGLFLASVPIHYQQLLDTCVGNNCTYYQISPEEVLILQNMGFSLSGYAIYSITIAVISTLAFTGIALFIFWRQSNEWMSLLASLWLVTFGTNLLLSLPVAEIQPIWRWSVVLVDYLGWVGLLPLFLFTFPNGRFIPRWTFWIYLAFIATSFISILIDPANANLDTPTPGYVQVIWLATQLAGVLSQVYRYRRASNPSQRQQTKWVVFGLVATVLMLALYSTFNLPNPLAKVAEITFVSFAFLIIPLTLGVSILRYQLWDIDLIISRTLIWGLLSGIVIGLYVLIVGGLGTLFQSLGTFLPSILATGLIALLFHPLRQRVQRGVNRLIYGKRDEPYAVLSQLGRQLEATLAPEAVLPTIVETVAQTLKLPYVAIALKEGGDFHVRAATGSPVELTLEIPLTYQGEVIGQLICGRRHSGESFKGEEQHLLQDIASQTGVALQALQSNAALQRSRERLVITREEERRRIRRDLHDGLGPALASQTLKIGSARAMLQRDPEAADKLLQQLESDSKAALKDIRHLVYNLRPPALDELGLLRAIQQDVPQHQGLDIIFDFPPELPPLSAAVEAAVYRIVQEALANVVRHAQASRVCVGIETSTDLCLMIIDNGQGFPDSYRSGVGLNSMRERAEELGGTLKIVSAKSVGTTIEVRLPLRGKEA
jgi:signal transduction histidine kinase